VANPGNFRVGKKGVASGGLFFSLVLCQSWLTEIKLFRQ
jgi:hypothetical protein